jgi:glutaredoxin 3
MANVEIYTKDWCPYSIRARDLLDAKGVAYREIDVTDDKALELEMIQRAGRLTVPQVFIDDYHVGGSDDLATTDQSGNLDRLLAGQGTRGAA